jgi:ribonuclease HI
MKDQELLKHLSELERRAMLAAGADSATIDALLTDDFFEFGRSGKRWDKAGILAMKRDADTHALAADFALTRLGDDHVLLTYVSTLPGGGNQTLRSSIWVRTPEGWRMRFHQGTPQPNGG